MQSDSKRGKGIWTVIVSVRMNGDSLVSKGRCAVRAWGLPWGVLVMLLLLLSTGEGRAQSRRLAKADELYEVGAYSQALPLYKENLVTVPKEDLGDYLFKVGECYRRTGDWRQAELWYQKAIMRNCKEVKARLYYADMLLMSERYDLARDAYRAYLELVPEDPLGKNGLASVDVAIAFKNSPSGYVVQHMPVLNTKWDDYCPMYGSDDYRTLVLTSAREGSTGKGLHAATGAMATDLYIAMSNGEGRWGKPRVMGGTVNTNFEEGAPNVSSDFTRLYYTQCRLSKKGKLGCQIYEATQTGEGWDGPVMLPLAADSLVVAHPAISADRLTLYFTSDLPGGFGGTDLWKVTRANPTDAWGEPINLGGKINTAGNEMFPYSHADGTLYFSSDGHVGMGGLDIFQATKWGEDSIRVVNMRYPINSSADDFGITFRKDREEGFFTSNRPGGRGGDDIYWFYLPPLEFSLVGDVRDEKTDSPMAEAEVKLVGSDGSVQVVKTDSQGQFKFKLNPNTDYIAITSSNGYFKGKVKTTTKGKTASEAISVKVGVAAMDKPVVLPNIFYDFNRWELRPESRASLVSLVELLKDNPSIVIELGSHTDGRGSEEYNYVLSQKRAQSVVNFLIENGIEAARLRAKGYAQTQPIVVERELHDAAPFLPIGQRLDEAFINTLPEEQQELAHQANRRTTFRVLRDDYVPGGKKGR